MPQVIRISEYHVKKGGCKKTAKFEGPRFHIRDPGPSCYTCMLKMGYISQIRRHNQPCRPL